MSSKSRVIVSSESSGDSVLAKYILAALAVVFLVLAVTRRATPMSHPQTRAWLIIGVIFAAVSAWLFSQG